MSGCASSVPVVVVGAGLSGLALAQAIRRTSLGFVVLEKDPSFSAPGRKVRVHCNPQLNEMAAACLPPGLFELFVAGQSRPDARHIYLDERLKLVSVDERPAPEVVLDTCTARQVLAIGLADRLRLGAEVRAVRDRQSGACLDLASGGQLTAGLCVLADGADTSSRREFAFGPRVRDVGLWSFYGVVDLREPPDLAMPDWLEEGFVVASNGEVKVAMGRYAPARSFARLAARESDGTAALCPRQYLFWNVIAPSGSFPSDPRLWGRSRRTVVQALSAMTGRFDPWLHRLFALAGTDSYGFLPLRTSAQGEPRPRSAKTILIGDAAHPMLPAALSTRVAFEDARVLGEALAKSAGCSTAASAATVAEAALRSPGFGYVAEAERAAGPAFGIPGLTA